MTKVRIRWFEGHDPDEGSKGDFTAEVQEFDGPSVVDAFSRETSGESLQEMLKGYGDYGYSNTLGEIAGIKETAGCVAVVLDNTDGGAIVITATEEFE